MATPLRYAIGLADPFMTDEGRRKVATVYHGIFGDENEFGFCGVQVSKKLRYSREGVKELKGLRLCGNCRRSLPMRRNGNGRHKR